MTGEVRDPSPYEPIQSPLIDVSELPLTVVMTLPESVFGNALRRLQAEAQNDSEIIATWGNNV